MELNKSGVGSWEAYTKGIGSKILFKNGFKPGKGLGKSLQGISAPVEVHVRNGRGGIGAYGSEKNGKFSKTKTKTENTNWRDVDENKDLEYRKSGKSEKEKIINQKVDKTLEGAKLRSRIKIPIINKEIAECKVIDMTTLERQVFSNYQALNKHKLISDEDMSQNSKKRKSNFSLPGLHHDLDMIIDTCEQKIIQNNMKPEHISFKKDYLEEKKTVNQYAKIVENSEGAFIIITKLLHENCDMSLEEIADRFKILQERHYEEFKACGLRDSVCTFISQKAKEKLENWDPLMEPDQHLSFFTEWKNIIEYGRFNDESESMSSYDLLVGNIWLPVMRTAVKNWDCRQAGSLVNLLKLWSPVLPPWVQDNLFDMIIHQKLTIEVEEWNPCTDTVSINTWIDPWLTLMREKMDASICPIIRRKLASVLNVWHPSDSSVRVMLEQCSNILANCDMNSFLLRYIVPNLHIVLSKLIINPHKQNFDQWYWFYHWKDVIPVNILAALLDKCFFPKWFRVLSLWLNHSTNFEQIIKWYKGWKGMLNDKVFAVPIIKENFEKGLNMVDRSISIQQGLYPYLIKQTSYLIASERIQVSQPKMGRSAETMSTSQTFEGFKDLVQRKCEERGILFMPLSNKYYEGRQIYKMGNYKIYIEKNVLFVYQDETMWLPMKLTRLLKTGKIY